MHKFLLPTLVLSATALSVSFPNQALSAKGNLLQQIFSWTGTNLRRDSLYSKGFTPLPIESRLQPIQIGNYRLKMSRFTLLPSWKTISQILFSKKPPVQPRHGASRGPGDTVNPCMISPDALPQPRIVWSDHPLFIWLGPVQKIAVRLNGSDEYLWSQTVTGRQSTKYTGKALQPGQTYEWLVLGQFRSPSVVFQMMDAQQRDRITAQLQTQENKLKAKGADQEAIALAKAKYFADNQLWSDMLQQAYSLPKPSPELAKIRQELPQQLCNP